MTSKGLKGRLDRLRRPEECPGCKGYYPNDRQRSALVRLSPPDGPARKPPYSDCVVCRGKAVPPPTEPPCFEVGC